MFAKPGAEHQWLMQLVGEWEFENDCIMGPNGEKARSTGREVVRSIGDLWVMGEMTGSMPGGGGSMTGIMTVGFDPARGRYVGTWFGSPTTHMFIYDGWREGGGNVLTLQSIGPSFIDPTQMVTYQDIVELRGPNERMLYSQTLGPDGRWMRFMEGVFRRRK